MLFRSNVPVDEFLALHGGIDGIANLDTLTLTFVGTELTGNEKIYTITPESAFIDEIQITGNEAIFKMRNNGCYYHYDLNRHQIKELLQVAKNKQTFGKWYNSNLRGSSVAKTIFK